MNSRKVKIAIGCKLKEDAELAALVGKRVYSSLAVQGGEEPYITFATATATDLYTHSGNTELTRWLCEFNIVANEASGADIIRDLLQKSLENLARSTFKDVRFGGIFLRNDADLYDQATRNYRKSLDFEIHFRYEESSD